MNEWMNQQKDTVDNVHYHGINKQAMTFDGESIKLCFCGRNSLFQSFNSFYAMHQLLVRETHRIPRCIQQLLCLINRRRLQPNRFAQSLHLLKDHTHTHTHDSCFRRPFRAFVKTCVRRRSVVRCSRPKALEHSARRPHICTISFCFPP